MTTPSAPEALAILDFAPGPVDPADLWGEDAGVKVPNLWPLP